MARRNDRKLGDPHNISKRGKATSRRKSSRDPGWTPSETRVREKLMKQFCKLEGPSGNSDAFKRGYDAINWSKA